MKIEHPPILLQDILREVRASSRYVTLWESIFIHVIEDTSVVNAALRVSMSMLIEERLEVLTLDLT